MPDDAPKLDLIKRIRRLCQPLQPRPTDQQRVLPKLPDIRAVVFDVYGTLLISGSGDVGTAAATDSATALKEALAAADLPPLRDEAGALGVGLLHDQIAFAHQQGREAGVAHPEIAIDQLWADVLADLADRDVIPAARPPGAGQTVAVEYECRVNPTWPMPNLAATLADIRSRGLTLGIVSNAQFFTPLLFDALLDQSLDDLGFDPRARVWSYELREAKPSKRLYADLLAILDADHSLAPSQVLYVGNDIRNDIAPAAALGCRTALFAGDTRSLRLRRDKPELAQVKPEAVITDLSNILKLI